METQPLKVIHVVTKSNWGGAQKYVYDLATGLPRDRFQSIVAFGGKGPLASKLESAGIRTISIEGLGRDIDLFGDISCFFKLLEIFKKEKPDIVHVNSSKVGGLGALAGRLAGIKKIVFTCHGWPFNEDRGIMSRNAIRFLSWITVLLSHETIAVSERDYIDGENMLGADDKLVLIHNGIRIPEFKDKAAARREIAALAATKGVPIRDEDFLIGAIGELHKNKAYKYALEALHSLKREGVPAKLAILGEGEERKSLEESMKNLEIEKDTALLGFVGNAPSYLPAFNAFLLTSIKEGLPYVLIEAGFAGLPLVATNVGGVREIIEDMRSGILVQTRKPLDVAQGLEWIYKNKEKAEEFGLELKERTEREFSLSKMIEKTIEVYSA